jgi:hypothetical protein
LADSASVVGKALNAVRFEANRFSYQAVRGLAKTYAKKKRQQSWRFR